MKTPREKLESCIVENGWRIENVQYDGLDWWVDEIWELRSIWSPEGVSAYLSLLVDPLHEGARRKGQGVWAVGCSGESPASLEKACSNGTVTLNEISKGNAIEVIDNIESLRSGAINDIGL
ncbi:hypothetical protein [uncultured Pseudoteredinibacter sp.]|uniref:hypothetical protein n=1 Tax=uncultured Pseudoteredinibacter sp. TaxID=1641701 RepID=UPI0026195175|nr:hypothetical protein [uncultured Pseudoteredinibacter sp.]